MQYGRLTETIVNHVLDTPIVMGQRGERVLVHEIRPDHYEVSTEKNASTTFYATKTQVELI